jgi:hypothetical protein
VEQQRQQQAEMARRMRVRPLLHLQALGELTHSDTQLLQPQALYTDHGLFVLGLSPQQEYQLYSFSPQTNQLTLLPLIYESMESPSKTVHIRSVVVNNRLYLFENLASSVRVWAVDPKLQVMVPLQLLAPSKQDELPNRP